MERKKNKKKKKIGSVEAESEWQKIAASNASGMSSC